MNEKTMPSWVINFFFYLGMVSALLFRSTIIANRFNSSLGRILWYIAVCGYICFFAYRFYISRKRRRVVKREKLLKKISASNLSDTDKASLDYLLSSIVKSKEMINYIVIFTLSLVAIAIDLLLTIIQC